MGSCRAAGASLCRKPRFRYLGPNIRASEDRGHGNAATQWFKRSSVYSIFRWRGEVEISKPWFWTQRSPRCPARTHLSFGFLRDSVPLWCKGLVFSCGCVALALNLTENFLQQICRLRRRVFADLLLFLAV